jgi:hypothetical protein
MYGEWRIASQSDLDRVRVRVRVRVRARARVRARVRVRVRVRGRVRVRARERPVAEERDAQLLHGVEAQRGGDVLAHRHLVRVRG